MTYRLLEDGHSTLVGFGSFATVEFEEITVNPPGLDGGGAKDVSTMTNQRVRTQAPKRLYSVKEMALTVAYDPKVYTTIKSMLQVNQQITVTMPDNSTVVFWGWLESFDPKEHKEGDRPTADIKLMASNRNASNVETAPAYTAAPSTTTTGA